MGSKNKATPAQSRCAGACPLGYNTRGPAGHFTTTANISITGLEFDGKSPIIQLCYNAVGSLSRVSYVVVYNLPTRTREEKKEPSDHILILTTRECPVGMSIDT